MKKIALLLALIMLCAFCVEGFAEDGGLSEPGVLPIWTGSANRCAAPKTTCSPWRRASGRRTPLCPACICTAACRTGCTGRTCACATA